MRPSQRASNMSTGREVTRCYRCEGSVMYDRLDEEWRCLQCGREQSAVSPGSPSASDRLAA